MSGTQNNNYTGAKEILRYLSGRMDRKEMHAFERAALDDDLLADAIEGYRLMRETLTDEAILDRANGIHKREEKEGNKSTPVVKIPLYRWAGYAMAASFVVAAGWWLFSLSRPDAILPLTAPDVAQQEFNPDLDSGEMESSAEKLVKANEIQIDDKAGKIAEKGTVKPKSQTKDVSKIIPGSTNNDLANVQASPVMPPVNTEISQVNISTENATTALRDSGKLRTNRMVAADIQKAELSYPKFQISDSSIAVPSIGWASYQNFLKANLKLSNKNLPGEAVIRLSGDGKIEKVEVEGAFTAAEKKSMADTIMNGPDWKNKTEKPAKLVIQWR